MKPAPFEYHAPDAAILLADLGDGAKVQAGGLALAAMISMTQWVGAPTVIPPSTGNTIPVV